MEQRRHTAHSVKAMRAAFFRNSPSTFPFRRIISHRVFLTLPTGEKSGFRSRER